MRVPFHHQVSLKVFNKVLNSTFDPSLVNEAQEKIQTFPIESARENCTDFFCTIDQVRYQAIRLGKGAKKQKKTNKCYFVCMYIGRK